MAAPTTPSSGSSLSPTTPARLPPTGPRALRPSASLPPSGRAALLGRAADRSSSSSPLAGPSRLGGLHTPNGLLSSGSRLANGTGHGLGSTGMGLGGKPIPSGPSGLASSSRAHLPNGSGSTSSPSGEPVRLVNPLYRRDSDSRDQPLSSPLDRFSFPNGPNGHPTSSPQQPAQASSSKNSTYFHPLPPPPPRDPTPPPPPSRSPSPSKTRARKSASPVKTLGAGPRRSESPEKVEARAKAVANASAQFHARVSDPDYRTKFLPKDESTRSKVSISLPFLTLPNGKARPRPPHLADEDESAELEVLGRGRAGTRSPLKGKRPADPPWPAALSSPPPPPSDDAPIPPEDGDRPTPSPPSDRFPPPSPPPPDDYVASPPPSPPPTDDIAPPPPSPPQDDISLPPPPTSPPVEPTLSSSRAPSPRLDPGRSRSPASFRSRPAFPPRFGSATASASVAPPSFHFRELIIQRPHSPSEESEEGVKGLDEEDEDQEEEILAVQPSARPRSRSRSPLDLPPAPAIAPLTEPAVWRPPPYEPPPAAFRRPGLGNFYVVHDPAIHGKNGGPSRIIRYDGEDGGQVIEPKDPRLAISDEVRTRGKGSMKNRTGYHELVYEWDTNSTGAKPPEPPTAVLITGLSPLTTVDQVRTFLRQHGRLAALDAKTDPRSGSQLGICWVRFEEPKGDKKGVSLTAHDLAVKVCRVCDGQRISLMGDERIKVVLDGRGLRAEKAVKEEMERRYPPKPIVMPPPPEKPSVQAPAVSIPSSAGAATPRLDAIRAQLPAKPGTPSAAPTVPIPKPLNANLQNRFARPPIAFSAPRTLPASLPARPAGLPERPSASSLRPTATTQQLSNAFTAAPFAPRSSKWDDRADSYVPRSHSRSYSHSSSCSTCSDSEDDRPAYRRRSRSPPVRNRYGAAREAAVVDRKDEEEKIQAALLENGHPAVCIDAKFLASTAINEEYLRDHFKAFKPSRIMRFPTGWYLLFPDDQAAGRAKTLLDGTAVQGHRITMSIKEPPSRRDVGVEPAARGDSRVEKGWKLLTIGKKTKAVPAPKLPSPKAATRTTRPFDSSSGSEDEAPRRPFRRSQSASSSDGSEAEALKVKPRAKRIQDSPVSDDEAPMVVPLKQPTPVDEDEPELDLDVIMDEAKPKSKKRVAAKPKASKVSKKAKIAEAVVEIKPPIVVEPEVAEIKLDKPEVKAPKVTKSKKPAHTPLDKLVADGTIADEEDAYWLAQALAAEQGIQPDLSDEEEEELETENHPLYHRSGSWRAEGWKKIPQVQKSVYLPTRNKAAAQVEDASALTSGRTARVTGRRLALDMETHRKTAAATSESDLLLFNQLRIRKKQLRFARSAIEGYGLYAMETIQPGEMVCEYVGELCRSSVADLREHRYLKQGIGSSYLFRIDGDVVCDATFRGSVSRLINHSCDPSASAKIISINGHSKIVIYAKRMLHPGEEILYDYKFPLESDPALRVPCLCGAETCRGWLN